MTPPAEALPPAGNRGFGWPLAAIAAVATVIRVAYLLGSHVDRTPTLRQGDAFWYSSTAANLAKGEFFVNEFTGQPTADHPPITALILAPASWLMTKDTMAQRLTMVVIGVLTVVVIGLVGRRLAGPVAGLVAAGVAAGAPALWVNDVVIMSESPTALVVAAVLWIGIVLAERTTPAVALAAGALCGLAALTRAETGLFLPFMVWPIVALAPGRPWSVRLRTAALATAATAAVVLPWTVFNLTRFSEPAVISVNDGVTLLGANCDPTYRGRYLGSWVIDGCLSTVLGSLDARKPPLTASDRERLAATPDRPCPDPLQQRPPCWDSSKISAIMRTEAVHYVSGHLSDLPQVVAARHGRVWGWYRLDQSLEVGEPEGRSPTVTRWGYYVTWALVPVTAAGAWVLHRRRRTVVPFAAALGVVVVTTTVFYGLVRFRLPYDVASCLLVGVAIDELVRRRRHPADAST